MNNYFKMSSKDDFLSWEELDLDELLGDYTDDDFYSTDISSSSSNNDSECAATADIEIAVQRTTESDRTMTEMTTEHVPPKSSKVRHSFVYDCPVCGRELRSVSGFRGHVMKQHQSFNLKGNVLFIKSHN